MENGWDVSWLGAKAGYLEGSAYPTWTGNTVLTAHVWGADGEPGPFEKLRTLRYGDGIDIAAWSRTYHYEVRENERIGELELETMLKHMDQDWLTLVTCEAYDAAGERYHYRRLVRAVLVDVE